MVVKIISLSDGLENLELATMSIPVESIKAP